MSVIFLGLLSLIVAPALAHPAPSVVVTPPTIPTGETVTLTITASVTNTVVSKIMVNGPSGNPGPWTWSGVPITLPDAGDAVSITFPSGVYTVVNDPDGDVSGGPGSWTAGANTGIEGSYWVDVEGTETEVSYHTITKGFVVLQEFDVPEFAFGTVIAITIGFIGLMLTRRRFKTSFKAYRT